MNCEHLTAAEKTSFMHLPLLLGQLPGQLALPALQLVPPPQQHLVLVHLLQPVGATLSQFLQHASPLLQLWISVSTTRVMLLTSNCQEECHYIPYPLLCAFGFQCFVFAI